MVDYLSWSQRLKLDDIPLLVKHCRVAGPLSRSALTERELQLLHNMIGRLSRLAEVAAQVCVCCTWRQSLALSMMLLTPSLHVLSLWQPALQLADQWLRVLQCNQLHRQHADPLLLRTCSRRCA